MAMSSSTVTVKKARKNEGTAAAAPAEHAVMHPLWNLREEIDRAFDRVFHGSPRWSPFSKHPHDLVSSWDIGAPFRVSHPGLAPRVDVSETDKAYEITAELPGIDEKDLSVTLGDDVLTLKGEKKSEREEKKKDYYLSERSYGSFERSFRLPEGVNDKKIEAGFANGVLTITLPKTAASKANQRKIAIGSK